MKKIYLCILFVILISDLAIAQTIDIDSGEDLSNFSLSFEPFHIQNVPNIKEFALGDPLWSTDGKYMTIIACDMTDMATGFNQIDRDQWHYIFNMENKTYGEIDYKIDEKDRCFIKGLEWVPGRNKINVWMYKFSGRTSVKMVFCDPDGSNTRLIGTQNCTKFSEIIDSIYNDPVSYSDLLFNHDSSVVAYDRYTKVGAEKDYHIWIENINDGTKYYVPVPGYSTKSGWYNSTSILLSLENGSVALFENSKIKLLFEAKKGERYSLRLSPDEQKFLLYLSIDEKNKDR